MRFLSVAASVLLVATLLFSLIPVAVDAGPADAFFFVGEWTCEDEYATYTYNFDFGGRGSLLISYGGEDESSYEFDWELEDGSLYIRSDDYAVNEDIDITISAFDETWEEIEYTFDRAYTKLTLKFKYGEERTFDKSGSFAGVCCPICSGWIAVPAVSIIAFGIFIRRR